jgi:hypothetical protein
MAAQASRKSAMTMSGSMPGGVRRSNTKVHSRARMFTAVPPSTMPMVRVAPLGRNGEAGSASRSSRSDRSDSMAISLTAAITAETPRWVRLEWASRPLTVTL